MTLDEQTKSAWRNVKERLGPSWLSVQTGYETTIANLTFRNVLGLFPRAYPEREFRVWFQARVDGHELLVLAGDGKNYNEEIFRTPLVGPKDWERLRAKTEQFYMEGLTRLFGKGMIV